MLYVLCGFAPEWAPTNMANSILQVENLVKRYGDVEAVRGVSFAVEEGEVFGLPSYSGWGTRLCLRS